MQIQLTGRHVEITDAIRKFIDEKFNKLERHFDHIISAHVIITVEKNRHLAEATILVSSSEIFAQSASENMYTAIDLLIDKLDRQIIKFKEKLKKRSGAN